jgi:tetratricopeptide (TPR) repeat protein
VARPLQPAVAALERLVSTGRSLKYGFRRQSILHPEVQEPGPAFTLVRRALARLTEPPRAQYGLQPGGISRRAKGARAVAAAKDALTQALYAARLDPGLALARVTAALACEDLGRRDAALRHLDAAVRLEPSEGWLYQFRADVRRRAGDLEGFAADADRAALLDESAAYFRFAAEPRAASLRRVIAGADRFLKKRPGTHWMLATRADCKRYPEINDFEGALRDFEAAVAAAPRCAWAWAYLSRARMTSAGPRPALEAVERAAALAPSCGWIRVWRGEVKRRLGDLRGAMADFEQGLSLDPGYEFGYAWRGGARRAMGLHSRALEDLDLAAALDPSYAWTFHERSLALRALGRVKEAVLDLERAARLDPKFQWGPDLSPLDRYLEAGPDDAAAWAWRGQGRVAQDDLAGGVADLSRALALEPRNARALLWRGRALALLGRTKAALADLDAAIAAAPRQAQAFAWRAGLRGPKRALADLSAAARLEPRAAWIWLAKAAAGERLGRWSSAAADYARARSLDARDTRIAVSEARALAKAGKRTAALELARSLTRGGEHEPCARACSAILDAAPAEERALRLRAEARRCMGDYAGAAADLDALFRRAPRDARRALSRGVARRTAWDFEGALADARLARTLSRRPLPESFILESEALRSLGAVDAAAAAASQALRLDPRRAWALVVRAKALRFGNPAAALADAERACALAPEDGKAQAWRALALRGLRRLAPAKRALDLALTLEPSCAWARALRGEVRRGLGDAAGCWRDVSEAARLDPRNSAAYDLLGSPRSPAFEDRLSAWVFAWRAAAYRQAGQPQPARADFDRAIALDASCFWARAWRGELLLGSDPKRALEDLDAALEALQVPDWLSWRGRALCALGRCEEARRAFRAALGLDPAHVWSLVGLGVCLEKSRQAEKALACFAKAKELAPGLFR